MLSNFENERDVTTYFVLDRTKTRALLSGRRKIFARLQKKKAQLKRLRACRDA